MSLTDKVVIITGAAKGIGLGCAQVLATDGASVTLTDIDEGTGEREALTLREKGCTAAFRNLDVTDWDSILLCLESVAGEYGRIDAIVNNAGFHDGKGLFDCGLDDWDRLLNLNLKSVFQCCKAVVPFLKETKGTIVNIASTAGLRGQNRAVAYCASKAGVIGMSKSLALELAPYGIRVNTICPSAVETPLLERWISEQTDPEAARLMLTQSQPLNRMAAIQEIGAVASFLVSDRSSFMTGEEVVVDGGATLGY